MAMEVYRMNKNQAVTQVRSASGLDILAAIWLIIAPFALGFGGALRASSVLIGIIVGILDIIRVSMPMQMAWLSWVNAVLGLWVIVSPFGLGYTTSGALWNSVIMGIIIAGLSIWSASATGAAGTGYKTTA